METVVNFMEAILQWFTVQATKFIQYCAGQLFSLIGGFIKEDNNVVLQVLKPVYNFGMDYIKPISLSLLILLMVWNMLMTMFGKFSSSKDDPSVLVVRTIIFGALIVFSPLLVKTIGVDYSGNSANSGIILQLSNIMNDIGTSNDDGANRLKINKTNSSSKLNSMINDGLKQIDKFLGTNALESIGFNNPKGDIDKDNYSSVKQTSKNSKKSIGEVLISFSSTGGGGFVIFLAAIILYIIVYGIMLLILAWRMFKICIRWVYRLSIFLVLLFMCPLAFACGPSKSTQRICSEWMRMIASYGVLVILTSAFLRIGQFVIDAAIYYSSTSSSVISIIFALATAFFFLKIIYDLEKYIEKLGLSAVGLPDSTPAMFRAIGMTASRRLTNHLFNKVGQLGGQLASDIKGSIGTKGQIANEALSGYGNESVKAPKGDAQLEPNQKLFENILGNDNDKSFIEDPDGNYALGEDGLMHELGEDGKALDGTELLNNERMSLMNDENASIKSLSDGLDDASPFTPIEETDDKSAFFTDEKGDYVMSKDLDTNSDIAVPISSLESSDGKIDRFSLYNNPDGSTSYKEDEAGSYAKVKDGGLVKVGKERFSMGDVKGLYATNKETGALEDVSAYYRADGSVINPNNKGMLRVKYGDNPLIRGNKAKYKLSNSDNASKYLSSNTNRISNTHAYNNKLPNGSRISDFNKIKFSKLEGITSDGTQIYTATQRLQNGSEKQVSVKVYDVNELTRDTISKFKNSTNPCEGYLPRGDKYIHIDKEYGKDDRVKDIRRRFK